MNISCVHIFIYYKIYTYLTLHILFIGLPGVLWSESSGSALPIPGVHLPKMGLFRHDDDAGSSSERNLNTSFRRARRGSGMKRRGSVGGNLGGSFRNKSPGGSFRGKNGVNLGSHSQLVWRNVDELANDPDQVRDLIHTCSYHMHFSPPTKMLISYVHLHILNTLSTAI